MSLVTVSQNADPVWLKGQGPALLVNTDITNPVYIDSHSSVSLFSDQIPALGSMAVDGSRSIWAATLTAGVKVALQVTQGVTMWAPSPAQIISQLTASSLPTLIASAVQAAGVPPIDNPATTYVIINQDIAAGGTFTTGHITMAKYQSWAMVIHADNIHNNADTIPYMRVRMKWSLQADNFDPVHWEDWVIPVTPFSFTFNYRNNCAGPCYSDTLDIEILNYDTVINTITIGVFGSYRQRLRSVFRGQYNWSGSSPVEAPGLGSDAMLAMISATNLVSGAQSPAAPGQLVNLWHGKASLYLNSVDAAVDDLEVHIRPQPSGSLPNQSDIVLTMDGGGPFTRLTDIDLPRRACTIFFLNAGQITIPSCSASLVMAGESE